VIFSSLQLAGALRIDLDRREDARGFFARVFCAEVFAAHGLETRWVQMNTSLSHQAGTLRGLHFQRPPASEVKLVRCLQGAIFDVIVDLRAGSSSFGQWTGIELSAANRSMVYVPKGFAHGFQTLAKDTELLYLHSAPYTAACEGGLHYADQRVAIRWPLEVKELSSRDAAHPTLDVVEPITP
jgi:dTDP-4-dehydrorhamnose 3,5-epimerase